MKTKQIIQLTLALTIGSFVQQSFGQQNESAPGSTPLSGYGRIKTQSITLNTSSFDQKEFITNTAIYNSSSFNRGISTFVNNLEQLRVENGQTTVFGDLELASGQLSLGEYNSGPAGPNNGTQLLLSGEHNTGANIGTKAPAAEIIDAYKLKIEGYDNDGTTVYPIFVRDENATDDNGKVDFYLKNRPTSNGDPMAYFDGIVGIGDHSPQYPLVVRWDVDEEYQDDVAGVHFVNSDGTEGIEFGSSYISKTKTSGHNGSLSIQSADTDPLFLQLFSGGAVIIGNLDAPPAPNEKLVVAGDIKATGFISSGDDDPTTIDTDIYGLVVLRGEEQDVMTTIDSQFLGDGEYSLFIEDKMAAADIAIADPTAYETQPDYVFESDYQLPPLESVEAFVKENQHLEGIPSKAEVKERQGWSMLKMDQALLKKVEELMLYTINQEKQIKAQDEKIAKLQQLVEQLLDR